MLSKILKICDNKVILFSQYAGLYHFLQTDSIDSYGYLELNAGNVNDLTNILKKFKEDDNIKVLLLDNISIGVGLNIEYATDMIFFSNVKDADKQQLLGRCQRFGRKGKLYVWNLKYKYE